MGLPLDGHDLGARAAADQLDDQIKHSDGTVWTRSELEHIVERTLAQINESAGAGIPYLYLDREDPSTCTWLDTTCGGSVNIGESCEISGAIHIVPTNCGTDWWYGGATGAGEIIQVQRANAAVGDARRDSLSDVVPQPMEFMLMHELGHALGLAHPTDCAPPPDFCPSGAMPCSLMGAVWSKLRNGEAYMPDDQQGLRSIWGGTELPTRATVRVGEREQRVLGADGTFTQCAWTVCRIFLSAESDIGHSGRLLARQRELLSAVSEGLRVGLGIDDRVGSRGTVRALRER